MKKKNLVFDIGNTHIVGGIYSQEQPIKTWRWSTDKAKTEDEYFCLLHVFLECMDIQTSEFEKIAISSVSPNLTRVFVHLFQKYFTCPYFVINAYTDLGLQFPMADPGFIGADLITNAFAAKEKYHTNCIICDFGTATTIQLVDENGMFLGTVISPGIVTSASHLFEKAAQLTAIDFKMPKDILATNTVDAIRSGIIRGNAYMVDGFIKDIKDKYSHLKSLKTIATGGMAVMIKQASKEIDFVDKNLTLDGLNIACMRF